MISAALTAFKAARAASGLGPMLIAGGIAFGIGFGAAEVYEHTAPWGLGPKRDALSREINDVPGGWKFRFEAMRGHRDNREEARKRCEEARAREAKDRKADVETAADERINAGRTGFDEGYAAGRAVGARACKKEEDDAESDLDGGAPSPRGVPDPQGGWAPDWNDGRYDPGRPVRPERRGG